MSNKDYRELQLTSSQLVIIFLAIIILGVVIFLLGISVGKKKTEIVLASQSGIEQISEKITEQKTPPVESPKTQPTEKSTQQKKAGPEQTKTSPQASQNQNLNWFIQVGAFFNREGAETTADKFREQGRSVVILEPYATDRRAVYRVRIGGYASRDLAEQAKANLVRADPKASDYLVIQDDRKTS